MPLSWIMGVPWDECEKVGMLIGLKIVVNELIAYQRMGELKDLSARSRAIATFAVCGFANPSSIGSQIGLFSSLAPEKRNQVTGVILRSFVVGSATCFLTASIAGKVAILDIITIISRFAINTRVTTNIMLSRKFYHCFRHTN